MAEEHHGANEFGERTMLLERHIIVERETFKWHILQQMKDERIDCGGAPVSAVCEEWVSGLALDEDEE